MAGPLPPDTGLAGLAAELLARVDQRRQLILTARSFAPAPRRTYDSLAAELGITREQVRHLETDALAELSQAAADDRYARLWSPAESEAPPAADTRRSADDAPAWVDGLLRWLSGDANWRPDECGTLPGSLRLSGFAPPARHAG